MSAVTIGFGTPDSRFKDQCHDYMTTPHVVMYHLQDDQTTEVSEGLLGDDRYVVECQCAETEKENMNHMLCQ